MFYVDNKDARSQKQTIETVTIDHSYDVAKDRIPVVNHKRRFKTSNCLSTKISIGSIPKINKQEGVNNNSLIVTRQINKPDL